MEKDRQIELREWISSRLKQRGHGARARLAEYIGVNRDAITRMLKPVNSQGYRVIKAEELSKIADFFGELPPGFNHSFEKNLKEYLSLYEQASPKIQEATLDLLRKLVAEGKK